MHKGLIVFKYGKRGDVIGPFALEGNFEDNPEIFGDSFRCVVRFKYNDTKSFNDNSGNFRYGPLSQTQVRKIFLACVSSLHCATQVETCKINLGIDEINSDQDLKDLKEENAVLKKEIEKLKEKDAVLEKEIGLLKEKDAVLEEKLENLKEAFKRCLEAFELS